MPAIVHVTQPTDAGVAAYVAALSADQQARGWDVAVACPDDGRLRDDLAALGICRIPWQAGRTPNASVVGEALRLRRLLDHARPELVHLHSSKAGLAGRLAVRGRLPTIFQPHGWSWLAAARPLVWATVAWERLAARWTSLFICVGEGEAAQARAHDLAGPYCVVRSGVDLMRFRPAAEGDRRTARALLGLALDAPLAVCVGRVSRQKGQDVLLAAWPAVRSACPDATLALVGGGDLLETLRNQAPPGVKFVGPVEDPHAWYVAADLVVLPSRWEGLPLTLLEALAVGRSVVGSDIPGIADALPEKAGAVVPVEHVAALAEAIGYRLRYPDVAGAEGEAGANYAAAEADVRRTFDALAAVTVRLAGRRP
ncbi:MAG TPA: glycosyltransferase [Micromonosporaceae bacterium]|nr:glycosyltransferase [Micromonosporaceae bacterium]